jgi:hypothetical protein
MAGIARHFALSRKIVLVDAIHHQNHSAGSLFVLGFFRKVYPCIRTVLRMTVGAIHAQSSGKHSHRVHEFIYGNSLQGGNVLENFLGHWHSLLRLSSLAAHLNNTQKARDHHAYNTQNRSPRSGLHFVSLSYSGE